jgi:hypothetical protein
MYNKVYTWFGKWNILIVFVEAFMQVPLNGIVILPGFFGLHLILRCLTTGARTPVLYNSLATDKTRAESKKMFEFN